MEYCVLIEISQTNITFSAYTGGESGFVSYGGENRPLAVWFSGSSVIIGQDAKQQAIQGTPNAFYNLFGQMTSLGQFDYANETHDYNKLVLYTIRAGLKEFFMNVLRNSQGALEDNIAHLPLVIIFGADMDHSLRSVVVTQLKDNGFGNIWTVEEDEYIISSLPSSKTNGQSNMVLSSDGVSLYGALYSQEKNIDNFVLEGAGRDPRVDKLAELIWERTMAENDWLMYESELPELQKAANRYIMSGEDDWNSNVTLSNGGSYPYYLNKADLNLYNRINDTGLVQKLLEHVSAAHIDKRMCNVILKGLAANNKYLYEMLNPEFVSLSLLGKDLRKKYLSTLLDDCKARNFLFLKQNVEHADNVIKVSTFVHKSQVSAITKRDEREFKIFKLSIETYKKNGNAKQAQKDAEEFLAKMHTRNLNQFDKEVEQLLDWIEVGKPIAPIEPSSLDKRNFRVLKAQVNTLMSNGKQQQARKEIDNFKREMREKGITFFDVELGNLLTHSETNSQAEVKTPAVNRARILENSKKVEKSSSNEEAVVLMRAGKLKEAREQFRANGKTIQADDCTKIIKWERLFSAYEKEYNTVTEQKNKVKARAIAKEIEEYIRLYGKYQMDTTSLKALANNYKQIK